MANSLQKEWSSRTILCRSAKQMYEKGAKPAADLYVQAELIWERHVEKAGLTLRWVDDNTCVLSNGEIYIDNPGFA